MEDVCCKTDSKPSYTAHNTPLGTNIICMKPRHKNLFVLPACFTECDYQKCIFRREEIHLCLLFARTCQSNLILLDDVSFHACRHHFASSCIVKRTLGGPAFLCNPLHYRIIKKSNRVIKRSPLTSGSRSSLMHSGAILQYVSFG